jgi:hypothetical protein
MSLSLSIFCHYLDKHCHYLDKQSDRAFRCVENDYVSGRHVGDMSATFPAKSPLNFSQYLKIKLIAIYQITCELYNFGCNNSCRLFYKLQGNGG